MTGSNESIRLHTLTRSSEAGCVFRNDTFTPVPDFSSAASRLNILCRASVSNRKTKRMRERTRGLLSGRNMPWPRVSGRSYQLSGASLLDLADKWKDEPSYSCFREWGSSINKVVIMFPKP